MLQCSRSKEYKAKGAGQKVYATRMTGCPWRAKLTPSVGNGWKVTTFLEVQGDAHYLPAYAGNLDIMTSAALQTAEKIARRRQAKAAA